MIVWTMLAGGSLPAMAEGELPVPTGLEADLGGEVITMTWSVDPAAEDPTGFDVETMIEPDGDWTPATDITLSVEDRTFTVDRPVLPVDLHLGIRIRSTGPDNAVSAWSDTYHAIVPAAEGDLPVPTDVNGVVEDGTITVSWAVDSEGPQPTGFDVDTRFDPEGEWATAQGITISVEDRTITAADPMLQFDIDIQLRIRSTGPDDTTSLWSVPYLLHIPGHPMPNSDRFDVVNESEVLSHEDLVGAGMTTWPNGQIGILPSLDEPGSFDIWASQGDEPAPPDVQRPGFGRIRGTLADPLQEVVATHQRIQEDQAADEFVGGGRVWRDPDTHTTVMFYQRKWYTAEGSMYSTIGAASSTDDGATFTDLGIVIQPEIGHDPDSTQWVGPGDAAPIVVGNDLYLYFGDTLATGQSIGTTVARIPLTDLRAAVTAEQTPQFEKWHDGSFSTPGVGGASSPVLAGLDGDGWDPDVIYSECRKELVMIANVAVGTTSQLAIMTSTDGTTWSNPEALYDAPSHFRIFNTLIPDDLADGQSVRGAGFSILTVTFPGPTDFWSAATVDRVQLVDNLAEDEGCLSGPPVPTDVRSTVHDGEITLRWDVPASDDPPVDYRVESQTGPNGEWIDVETQPGVTLDAQTRTLTAADPMLQFDVDVPVRVRSIDSDDQSSDWSATHVLHLTGHPLPTSERFEIVTDTGDGSPLVSDAQLEAAGMDTWPDGQFGILSSPGHPGEFDFYANEGDAGPDARPGIGHTRGTLDNPLGATEADPEAGVITRRDEIAGLQTPGDYVGGGRVLLDPDSDDVLMVYHHERYTESHGFYGSLGLARSTDGGEHFTDLGLIIEPELEFGPDVTFAGAGDGAPMFVNGDLYVYFQDTLADGTSVGTTVARATATELADALEEDRAPVFEKWSGEAFDEPGLGGASASILEGTGGDGWNPDVIYSECRQEYIAIANVGVGATSQLVIQTSHDGINWSNSGVLYDEPSHFRIYNTLIGADLADGKVITGSDFGIITVTFPGSNDFWSTPRIDKLQLVDHDAQSGCVSGDS